MHDFLSLSAEVAGSRVHKLATAVGMLAKERGLHLEITQLPPAAGGSPQCGMWITVLGGVESGRAIAEVSRVVCDRGLTVSQVQTIGEDKMVGVNLLARRHNISEKELQSLRQELLEKGAEWGVDLAVQRDDVFRSAKRLLCMDVDSTFVKGEFIDDLAELIGVKDQVAAITAQAMKGELDFEGALRKRVALLEGLPMSRALELCERFELTPGAADLVNTAKRLGMKVGLVSGGFTFFVELLRKRFGLDFAFANELEVTDGKLTGRVIGTVVDSQRKEQVLRDMAHVFDIRLQQTIAAGDGANDIEMLKCAGLGIAYQAKPRLQQVADSRLNAHDRLDTLLYLMGIDAAKLGDICG